MFRELRKANKAISAEAAVCLLETERRGVLSVQGDDGYPYGVPINFLYCAEEGKIWFHGARAGHKADAIKRCGKVCFTVFGNASVKEEAWAPFVQSVIVFGRCRPVGDPERAAVLVRRFAAKYYPDAQSIEEEAAASGKAVQMYEIEIEHLSGKEIQEK